jgi:hypothetical protein
MTTFARVSFVLASLAAAGAAHANSGPHLHPHLTEAPMVNLHPALGLVMVVACWAALVWGVESFEAARRRAVVA